MTYFRENIEKMNGYTPGEQPKTEIVIKLNTNENPYPPSPKVSAALKNFDAVNLKLYPNPTADNLRNQIAKKFNLMQNNIIVGNGSDDILTIVVRAFVGENESAACFTPTYSLYPILTEIQNSKIIQIPLNGENFAFPEDLLNKDSAVYKKIESTKIFFIARPNAPTGTNIDLTKISSFCSIYNGIVFIDEAYVDFSENTALSLLSKHPNVIISRTLSKSYSLAGLRLGWAMASSDIITGMLKVKDSYNANTLSQVLAIEALKDTNYFNSTVTKIKKTRERLTEELIKLGFYVLPSQTNFLFIKCPKNKAHDLFQYLRNNNIIVRYFPEKITKKHIRITIGTDKEINQLLSVLKRYTCTDK
jgi:histidinol-phosphate aminotransferase